MSTRALMRPLALVIVFVSFGLTGCMPTAPSTVPSSTAAASTPTPDATRDPTIVPQNRFGVACADLVRPEDLAAIFGAPLAPWEPRGFSMQWTEALIQDGVLTCRWGDGPFQDNGPQAVTVSALPYGPEIADLVSGFVPAGVPAPMPVQAVGDAAWTDCSAYDFEGFGAYCTWVVKVAETWLVVEFDRLGMDQVDAVQLEYGYRAIARSDTASGRLVVSIADRFSGITAAAAAVAEEQLSDCAGLADWQAVEDALGPLASVSEPRDPVSPKLDDLVLTAAGWIAADHQSIRSCVLEFGTYTDVTIPTWVEVIVVPNGLWIEGTGLWSGWGSEQCRNWEGGPICERSVASGSTAVHVRSYGERREGVPTLVVQSLTV